MANTCANYLQVVTKDTLENQVGLGICMARFASRCGIIGAHPKQSRFQLPLQLRAIIGAHPKHGRFQLPLQLGAKCLVISQLTISILGVLRRHRLPLAIDPHTGTGVNSRSTNNSSRAGGRIRSGPQVGQVATQPLLPRGSPPLQSGGAASEVAHKWAKWLHNPCRLEGSPPLQTGGQN